ncbi:hypothetical protein M569_08895 [Genlisea aurea]|uniref:TMEM205-like domain-containing protein n=1 Tax=Genlisea aurea TaxID=192259 RepID=S8CGG1_9LAMI|nr:hypothetical protein M569_08895 [Genlisea aurea]
MKKNALLALISLALTTSSLAAAGIFTPTPPEKQNKEDFLVIKEGHRVVVVEYENDDAAGKSTKVSISPHHSAHKASDDELRHEAKESSDKEEKASDADNKAPEKLHEAKESSVKEKASDSAHKASEKLHDAKETVKEKASDSAHKASGKLHEAKETVKEKASEKLHEAKGSLKETVSDAAHKASVKLQEAKESVVKEKAADEKLETAAESVKKKGKRELKEILNRFRELASDVYEYAAAPSSPSAAFDLLTGTLNLVGFSAAYGACVWVTFASSCVLSGALPRQHFAAAQGKIYPAYFKFQAYGVAAALSGHLMNRNVGAKLQTWNLVASLAAIVLNLLRIEPLAARAAAERAKKLDIGKSSSSSSASVAETTAGRVSEQEAEVMKLNEDMRRLNSYSSMLNVVNLVSLTWYLLHLAQRLNNTPPSSSSSSCC